MNETPVGIDQIDNRIRTGIQTPPLVGLPEQYQKRLAGQKEMPQPDFGFVQKLFEKINVSPGSSTEGERKPLERENFFAAISEIKEYALTLREEDNNTESVSFDNSLDTTTSEGRKALNNYVQAEKKRPSTKRIRDIVYLFLHMPKVKSVYSQIHAEKMTAALPEFSNS